MSEAFTLYLMRHGEPLLAGRMLGSTDCDATPAGIAACREQAADLACDAFISSDLKRAADCARMIAGEQTVVLDPRWRELDFGAWDGVASSDIDQAAIGKFWADPDGAPPPGGERWSALVARVSSAIDAIEPRSTLVVTHGGAIRAAIGALCGFSYDQLWSFDLPYSVVVGLKVWRAPRSAQIIGIWP